MSWFEALVGFLGGMGLLLYGIHIMSEGLQKIAGERLRYVLSRLTYNRFTGMIVGAVVTILFQSSTATTVILVGLTSASIISLRQTLGVILGADVGTTVTAQLIALKVTEIALPIVGIGATIIFFSKRDKYRRFGQAFLGFGLLFLGLKIMADTMHPLRDEPVFRQMLMSAGDQPVLAIAAAALFTFLVHSSAAAIGLIMVLAMQDMVSLYSTIYLLFGANIGTSFTAVISSLGSSREAQRVATAHLLFKVSGVLLLLPLVTPFSNLVCLITGSPGYQVAIIHTLFNVGIAVLFIPFTSHFAAFLNRILPDRKQPENPYTIKFLDNKMIRTPAIAIGLAEKEISHTYEHILDMTESIIDIFDRHDLPLLEKVVKQEEYVDVLCKEITGYLANILREPLSRKEFNKCIGFMHIVNDLEHIGDIIEKDISHLATCKIKTRCMFSEDGWDELTIMHQRVCELMTMSVAAFISNDPDMARHAVRLQPEITKMERHLRELHIHRLRIGTQNSEKTSSLHLDLINSFLRISEHVRNICSETAAQGGEPASPAAGQAAGAVQSNSAVAL
ncbi:MAG: Na/Pi cotransporter family protein [Firmicutes bacterium]|nr:Na/Pi cotransporter family protein [Bacillota bacterium]